MEIMKERLRENREFFSNEELTYIQNNGNLFKKIYLLGLLDAKEIYGKKL